MSLTKATYSMIEGAPISVLDYGAVADGVTDDSAAIQAALNAGDVVVFPAGVYSIAAPIAIQDGQTLHLDGAVIKPTSALTAAAISGTSISNVQVYGGTFEGVGTAFATGDEHLMLFTSCSNVQINGTKFTNSRSEGLRLVDCTNCVVSGVYALNNYGSGLQDRDGSGNKFIGVTSSGNGNTSVATYFGGRGLLIWRSFNTQVIGGTFASNTEYGIRVYSQVGDLDVASCIKVTNAHAEENGKIDFFVYNEIGSVTEVEFSGCTVRRTTDPTLGCIGLQGSLISWIGGSVVKIGTRMAVPAFTGFGLSFSLIANCKVSNAGTFIAWGTDICNDVLVSGNIVECARGGALAGTNITFRGNKFTHGGAGATDVAIDALATYSPIIDGNEFDGFWRNVSWDAQPITLLNNTSRNTANVSLRMNGDGVAGLVSSGNNWDIGSNPTFAATAYRQANVNSRLTVYGGAAPTTLTWERGDRLVQANPTVGLPKSWVCTVSGTPGTWVSEGNL